MQCSILKWALTRTTTSLHLIEKAQGRYTVTDGRRVHDQKPASVCPREQRASWQMLLQLHWLTDQQESDSRGTGMRGWVCSQAHQGYNKNGDESSRAKSNGTWATKHWLSQIDKKKNYRLNVKYCTYKKHLWLLNQWMQYYLITLHFSRSNGWLHCPLIMQWLCMWL